MEHFKRAAYGDWRVWHTAELVQISLRKLQQICFDVFKLLAYVAEHRIYLALARL